MDKNAQPIIICINLICISICIDIIYLISTDCVYK